MHDILQSIRIIGIRVNSDVRFNSGFLEQWDSLTVY